LRLHGMKRSQGMTTGVSLAGLDVERKGEQGQKQTAGDPAGDCKGVGHTPLTEGKGSTTRALDVVVCRIYCNLWFGMS